MSTDVTNDGGGPTGLRPWQVLASRPLLDRRPWLWVEEQDVVLSNGHAINGYILAPARDYAVIFALTSDGRVPLVRQYKHGLGRVAKDLPAGYLDDAAESPLACARRELAEETGLVSDRWQHLGSFPVDTNRGPTATHAFLAREARPAGALHLDETESLLCEFHPLAEIGEMISRGEVTSVASVACALLALRELGI
ncbi:MAG: NUDIX hydrolase [Anaerolineae bacterium]|nr:NUDIX hydrolase [Anaerolineae bacterium]